VIRINSPVIIIFIFIYPSYHFKTSKQFNYLLLPLPFELLEPPLLELPLDLPPPELELDPELDLELGLELEVGGGLYDGEEFSLLFVLLERFSFLLLDDSLLRDVDVDFLSLFTVFVLLLRVAALVFPLVELSLETFGLFESRLRLVPTLLRSTSLFLPF